MRLLICLLFLQAAQPAGQDSPKPSWERSIVPLLRKHCQECHDKDAKKGGLDLDALPVKLDRPESFAKWLRVYERIRDGEMPPKAKLPPDEAKSAL